MEHPQDVGGCSRANTSPKRTRQSVTQTARHSIRTDARAAAEAGGAAHDTSSRSCHLYVCDGSPVHPGCPSVPVTRLFRLTVPLPEYKASADNQQPRAHRNGLLRPSPVEFALDRLPLPSTSILRPLPAVPDQKVAPASCAVPDAPCALCEQASLSALSIDSTHRRRRAEPRSCSLSLPFLLARSC